MKVNIILSDSMDPYVNLALEEYLSQMMDREELIFYLWQNDHTVVIGRNQNPFLQCDMDYINANGVRIARRMSGGGAVYHDTGNLNYTIITGREHFSVERNFQIVLDVLWELQIHAECSGRNDIIAGTGKISGTAFFGNNRIKGQHGCMLVDTDIDRMFRCLKVNKDKIAGKDVDSVRARVVNMNELQPDITTEALKNKFVEIILRRYPEYEIKTGSALVKQKTYSEILDKYRTAEWNMGNQLQFQMVLYDRFSWGDCSVIFETDGAYIKEAGIYTDALETDIFGQLSEALKGVAYTKAEILNALHAAAGSDEVCLDICSMIEKEKQFYKGDGTCMMY